MNHSHLVTWHGKHHATRSSPGMTGTGSFVVHQMWRGTRPLEAHQAPDHLLLTKCGGASDHLLLTWHKVIRRSQGTRSPPTHQAPGHPLFTRHQVIRRSPGTRSPPTHQTPGHPLFTRHQVIHCSPGTRSSAVHQAPGQPWLTKRGGAAGQPWITETHFHL